jgi:hypothetical protein
MSSIPSKIKSLSSVDKKILTKTYEFYLDKGLDQKDAFDKACFGLGQNSDNLNSHALAQNIHLQTAVSKEGGLFNSNYYFDAVLSSSAKDDQGVEVSNSLLSWIDNQGKIEDEADIDHKAFKGESKEYKGLFKLMNHRMEDGLLKIRFVANKQHDKFKEFLSLNKSTPFTDLSAEFFNPKYVGNKMVYASRLGWTLTSKGSNPDAKILKGK